MNKNEQHSSKSGSFRARAMASTAQQSHVSSSARQARRVSSGNQATRERETISADVSMDMACTSHHYYG